jgi:putative endonuclease
MQGASKNIRWGLPRRWAGELFQGCRSIRARIKERLLLKSNKQVGRWGERTAQRYLVRANLSILDSNWRAGSSEADIIAQDGRTLVVVEVKTRHASLMHNFPALGAVTDQKRRTLHWLARSFMRNRAPLCRRRGLKNHRVDAVEVYYTPGRLGRHRIHTIRWHRGVSESNRHSPFDRYDQRSACQKPKMLHLCRGSG